MIGKPRIVCNTGPLIALGLLGFENVLPEIFSPLVPQAVLEELQQDDNKWHLPALYKLLDSSRVDPLLQTLLHQGEAAVIQAAVDLDISLVLMDEKRGRKLARRIYGLETIGTARILVEARKAGLVPNPCVSAELQKIGGGICRRGGIFAAWRTGFPNFGRRTGNF